MFTSSLQPFFCEREIYVAKGPALQLMELKLAIENFEEIARVMLTMPRRLRL
jgi:hypothetical protein